MTDLSINSIFMQVTLYFDSLICPIAFPYDQRICKLIFLFSHFILHISKKFPVNQGKLMRSMHLTFSLLLVLLQSTFHMHNLCGYFVCLNQFSLRFWSFYLQVTNSSKSIESLPWKTILQYLSKSNIK
jgi:hypothetical protein